MTTGRNEPCPCGSGKRYKNCCRNKDAPLKNEYRDQAAKENMTEQERFEQALKLEKEKVGDEVMFERDKELLIIELRAIKRSVEGDVDYFEKALTEIDKTIKEITALPLSSRQGMVLASLHGQRQQIVANSEKAEFKGSSEVVLAVLEENAE